MFKRHKNKKQLFKEFENISSFLFDCMIKCIIYDLDKDDYLYEIKNISACIIQSKIVLDKFRIKLKFKTIDKHLFHGFPNNLCEARILIVPKLDSNIKITEGKFLNVCNCYNVLSMFVIYYLSDRNTLSDEKLTGKILSIIDQYRCQDSFMENYSIL